MNTNKTNTGHLEGGAATTSLLSAILQLGLGKVHPVGHFFQLNPNLEASAFESNLVSEMLCPNQSASIANVSSFGFGGTNGHCVLWGESTFGTEDTKALFLRRIASMAPPEITVTGRNPASWVTNL